MDMDDIEYVRANLRFRGAQGTTGTQVILERLNSRSQLMHAMQASFMEIFHGDTSKIDRLNELLCEKAGFPATYDISTQTYSRKVDLRVANALSSFGATAMRICTVRSPFRFSMARLNSVRIYATLLTTKFLTNLTRRLR